jgi:hypothetical protein
LHWLIFQVQRELQLRIEAQGQSLQRMIEAQAKVGGMVLSYRPEVAAVLTPASSSPAVATPASVGPSTSCLTASGSDAPSGGPLVTTSNQVNADNSIPPSSSEVSKREPIETENVSSHEEQSVAKRARIDSAPQVNLSGQSHNSVVPNSGHSSQQAWDSSCGIQVSSAAPALQDPWPSISSGNELQQHHHQLHAESKHVHSSITGGPSSQRVSPQQAHTACVSQHPAGPVAQKPVQA